MPHPYENLFDDQRSASLRRTVSDVTRPCGQLALVGAEKSTQKGYVRVGFRAASQKSPMDAYGWRTPKPYSARLEGHTIYSDAVTRYRFRRGGNSCRDGSTSGLGTRQYEGFSTNVGTTILGLSHEAGLSKADALVAETQTAALKDFNSVKVDLSVAFVERKKTAELASSVARRLAKMAWAIRNGKFVKAFKPRTTKQGLTLLANTWLEYRYAWTPLVLDVYGALEALEAQDNGTYSRYIITAKRMSKTKFAFQGEQTPHGGYIYPGGETVLTVPRVQFRVEGEAQCRVRLDASLTQALYRRLADVGLTDPASTFWETRPYSFVCDWFLGVGDFLAAVNALKGYGWRGGTYTRFYTGTEEHDYQIFPSNVYASDVPVVFRNGKRALVQGFDRKVYLSPPTASIILKREPLNLTRLADSIALLWGAFGRRR